MPLVQSAFHIFQSTLPREERRNAKTSYSIRDNFNPRSHERSDVRSNNLTILLHNFNPRSHERSDESDVYLPLFLEISIHAPTRGATIYKELFDRLAIFQSTLPREERPSLVNACAIWSLFQSTLPREERPLRSLHW